MRNRRTWVLCQMLETLKYGSGQPISFNHLIFGCSGESLNLLSETSTHFIGHIGLRCLFFQWKLTKLSSSSTLFSYTVDLPLHFLAEGHLLSPMASSFTIAAAVYSKASQLVDFSSNLCSKNLQRFLSFPSPVPTHSIIKQNNGEKPVDCVVKQQDVIQESPSISIRPDYIFQSRAKDASTFSTSFPGLYDAQQKLGSTGVGESMGSGVSQALSRLLNHPELLCFHL